MIRVVTTKNYNDIFRGKTNNHVEIMLYNSAESISGRLVCFDDTQCTIHNGIKKFDYLYTEIAHINV